MGTKKREHKFTSVGCGHKRDKKWEKSWQQKTKKLQGNVPSSTEMIQMADGKKQDRWRVRLRSA